MAEIHRIGLDKVARHFEELEDPRSTVNRRHPLVSVVIIALMAVLGGADGPTGIARWAALKEEFLLQVLDLPNGIPLSDSVSEGATISVQWEPPDRLRRESFEGARKEG